MDSRKKMILAVALAVVWAGLAAWQWRLLEEPVHVPLTNVTGHPTPDRIAAATGTNWRVNLGLLASSGAQREAGFMAPRNIFAIPRPDGSLPPIQDAAAENQRNPVSEEPLAEQVEEGTPYRYLGFLRIGESKQKSNDIAVLSKGDEVMVLKVGDRVDDRLILRSITSESVTMRDTDTRTEKTVPLSDETMEQE